MDAQQLFDSAIAALQQGNLVGAESDLRQAVEIKDDFAQAYMNLMKIYIHQGRHDEIEGVYRKLEALAPHLPDLYSFFGQSLISQNRLEDAKDVARRAIAACPDNYSAYYNLGWILRRQGEKGEAAPFFEKAIELNPGYINAHKLLVDVRNYRTGDDLHIETMEQLLRQGVTGGRDVAQLHLSLGKAYGKAQNYEASFSHYKAGNDLIKATLNYDSLAHGRLFDNWKQLCSKTFLEQHRASGISGFSPIFVVGMPRSGTTLVDQILASHPDVYGAGELPFLREALSRVDNSDGIWAAADVRGMAEYYREKVRQLATDKQFIVDRMYECFFYIPLIKVMFPDARIVHCTRDPMAVCFSLYTHFFSDGVIEYAYDFDDMARYYRNYQLLLDHYRKLMPEFVLDVRYEDVVEDLEGQVRRVLDFSGLPWSDECLLFHRNERFVNTPTAAQVREPIYADSVGAWKKYENFLEPLRRVLQQS